MNVLEMQGLGFKAGNRYILKDIDWQVKKGEHWAVFGMNGSGKTTLLSIAAGFMDYTHGDMTILGEHYTDENILDIRRRIGWVSGSFYDKHIFRESVLDIVLAGKFGTLGLDYDITDQDVRRAKGLLHELRLGKRPIIPLIFCPKGAAKCADCPGIDGKSGNSDTGRTVYRVRCFFPGVFAQYCAGSGPGYRQHHYFVTHHTEEILDVFSHCLLLQNGTVYANGQTRDLFSSEQLSAFLDYPVQVSWQDQRIHVDLEVNSNIKNLMATL